MNAPASHAGSGAPKRSGLIGWLFPLGATRKIVVEGVTYRERRTRSLPWPIGSKPTKSRDVEVRFPGSDIRRRPMRIRPTATRIYDDLTPDPRVQLYRTLAAVIRPGDRLLELGCGTGAGTRSLAAAVGQSGGIVALDRDGESIRFARQRYRTPAYGMELGFELGWTETLAGELDSAFDRILLVEPFRDTRTRSDREKLGEEVIRLIRPGGSLLTIGMSDESAEQARRVFSELEGIEASEQVRAEGWRASLWSRTGGEPGDPEHPGTDDPEPIGSGPNA